MTPDRTEQEAWEDTELLPDMPTDARRWFLAERKRRKINDRSKGNQDADNRMEGQGGERRAQAQAQQEARKAGSRGGPKY